MTLTTEQLKNLTYSGGIVGDLARELLANREAQPVAWEMRYWSDGYNIWGDWERISEELYTRLSAEHATDNDYEFRVLYDAPLATNAADWGINMQTGTPILVYKNCSVIESEQAHYVLSLINSAAKPAPAVPDALEKMRSIVADPRALPRRKEWISGQQYSYVLLEKVEAMVDEACRAAMLAAAPESGNDHDTRR
ncbi:TPA: hypothetical protein F6U59_07390 [Serratia marcescens]|nr:hypothetical protein [Serratia marcescens]